jgi:type VI secretion system secreted protein VgrG
MDEKGRAKVQFHWDLSGQNNERSSCWVRVSQGYAGGDHGIQFHPLVDDEVIVDFLEGDPDRPIIVGRVYNAQKMPPLSPDNRIQNIILTPYQHRLIFDDKGSSITLNTGGSQTVNMVDGGENSDYGNCITISTSDGHTIRLAGGNELKGIELKTSDGHFIALEDPVQQIFIQTVGGHTGAFDDRDQHIGFRTTDGHFIMLSDANNGIGIQTNAGRNIIISDQNSEISVTNGNGDISLSASGKITISASEIELSTGENYKITMDSLGTIEVNGMEVNINGQLAVNIEGQMTLISGGMMNIHSDGPNIVEGTPLTLNP